MANGDPLLRRRLDDPMDRLMQKVNVTPGCWLWTAAVTSQGYGRFKHRGKSVRAHRWMLEQHLGRSLRPGYFACHHCDMPGCVNPEHLFEGTAQDNMDDKMRRGRDSTPSGDAHYLAKLSVGVAGQIRAQYAAGGVSQRELASRYGVAQSQISLVLRGETWAA